MQFVAGTAGLLLAGCAGGGAIAPAAKLTAAAAPDPQNLASLMKAAGVRAVLDKGVLYGADGSVKQVGPPGPNARHAAACIIYESAGRTTKATCMSDPGGSAETGSITCDDGPFSDPSSQWSGDGSDFGGFVGYGVSPVYFWDSTDIANQNKNSCAVLWAAATGGALNVAGQIVKLAPRFPPAITNSAQTALNNWQGTTAGIAASLEFLGLAATALGAADLLFLLGGIVGGGAAIYLAVECLRNQG